MVLLDTGTPGTSRENFSEDADVIEGLRVRVQSSVGTFVGAPVNLWPGNTKQHEK